MGKWKGEGVECLNEGIDINCPYWNVRTSLILSNLFFSYFLFFLSFLLFLFLFPIFFFPSSSSFSFLISHFLSSSNLEGFKSYSKHI